MDDIANYAGSMEKLADARVGNWLLMDTPVWTALLVALYLAIVYAGPKYMQDRAAFDIKPLLIPYNFALVILSLYMCYEFIMTSVFNPRFSLMCQTMDYSNEPSALRLANVCWMFFFSKIIEFLDTFIFIMRKKCTQLSFLHVYHHSSMVVLWWIGVKFVPGGESYFPAMINCGIHVLMYSYYGLSACGPAVQKFLWWKKYLTSLQLAQFCLIVLHTCLFLYVDCGYPRLYGYALLAYAMSHIILFSNFYKKAYTSSNGLQNGIAEKRHKQN